MSIYVRADKEVEKLLKRTLKEHQEELVKAGVEVSTLFTNDLKHRGWPAYAMVRITNQRDRCLGVDDAVIIIDQDHWAIFTEAQKIACLDHELEHLEVVYEDNGDVAVDDSNRPILKIRSHSHQFGWFDSVAKRHGKDSIEVMQALRFITEHGQVYLPGFEPPEDGDDTADDGMKAMRNAGKAMKALKQSLAGKQITMTIPGAEPEKPAEHDPKEDR